MTLVAYGRSDDFAAVWSAEANTGRSIGRIGCPVRQLIPLVYKNRSASLLDSGHVTATSDVYRLDPR